jgi:D-arabinose 1-dehydrogenase-like Zn-dependent alcohol dehydrogenase
MNGYRIREWSRDPVWEEIPSPHPGTGEVLVEVEACGVGLTVLNYISGDLADDPGLLPRVPGHELVGRVVELGPEADERLLGRRVTTHFYLFCGECDRCRAGREPCCRNLAGLMGVNRDGGYAPLATLPDRNAIPIPEEIDPVTATVVPDAVATPVHVCRTRAGVEPGDRVVVIGAGGGVGIHLVQMAQVCGAEVAGIEQTESKLEALSELGVIPVPGPVSEKIDPNAIFSGGPPTVVADLVGRRTTLDWAVGALDSGGRMVVLTTFKEETIELNPRDVVFGESVIMGSRYASRTEIAEAASLVAAGDIRPMIGAVTGPKEVLELHDRLRAGTLLGRGALDWRKPVE